MKKQLLIERFQQLAGIKPLYELEPINEFFNVFTDYENEWEGMEDIAEPAVEAVEGMAVNTKHFGEFKIEHGTIHLGSRFNRHKGVVDIIARAQDPEFQHHRIEIRIHMEANGEGSQKYELEADYDVSDIKGREWIGWEDDDTSFTSDDYIHDLVINKIREMLERAGKHMDEEAEDEYGQPYS